ANLRSSQPLCSQDKCQGPTSKSGRPTSVDDSSTLLPQAGAQRSGATKQTKRFRFAHPGLKPWAPSLNLSARRHDSAALRSASGCSSSYGYASSPPDRLSPDTRRHEPQSLCGDSRWSLAFPRTIMVCEPSVVKLNWVERPTNR